ncbi:recombinase family protein, partial [Bacillus cereus]|nr:recombinase family protein [Bacillus cereus]
KYHIKRSSFYKLVKEYKAQKTTTRTDKNDGYVERK